MFTYKVVSQNSSYEVIEADYFSITSDGFGGNDAYFYVTKTVRESELRSLSREPAVIKEILVGYAHNPRTVSYTDNFVYQPPGNANQTTPLTYPPGVR